MVDTNVDLENDFCPCGRFAWRVHCPHCGSYHNYSYTKRDTVRRADQSIAQLCVYRCRRCAAVFNDDEWKVRCNAPHISLAARSGRKTGDVPNKRLKFESVNDVPEQLRKHLEDVMKERGIK